MSKRCQISKSQIAGLGRKFTKINFTQWHNLTEDFTHNDVNFDVTHGSHQIEISMKNLGHL